VALFLALVLWPPALTNFQQAQWSAILATFVAVGFWRWDEGRLQSGAAWMAVAATLKLTPALLIPFVATRSRRALGTYLGVLLAAFLLALPLAGGLDAWSALRRDTGINVESWQTWWHNTLSLNGLVARLFVGGSFAVPLVDAPRVGRVVGLAAAAALTLLALAATLRRPAGDGEEDDAGREGCVFALWTVLIVVLNPLAWTHTALMLLLPAALIWRALEAPAAPLSAPLRRRLRAATGIAIIVLTIPKEALFIAASPLPTRPASAPILSAHLFAALLLFGAALAALRARRPTLPSAVES
jgi:Glycosyltransferase family 87